MEDGSINLYDYHKMFEREVQVSYKGPFDKYILSVIGNYINVIIGRNPKISKKIFSIFIELAQNIAYYSAERSSLNEDDSGIGSIVIAEYDDHYKFLTGNVVMNKDIVPIIEKCEIINSLDREELRKYKREQRNLPQGSKGSAHIGLIQVALTSCNPLDFEVTPINDEFSFFAITVKVDKYKD